MTSSGFVLLTIRFRIMKNSIILSIGMALLVISCNQKESNQAGVAGTSQKIEVKEVNPYSLDSLLLNAEALVGKKVMVHGYVTHACKHSGQRCFLADESQKFTLRVEAGGEIESFSQELIGSQIEVTGILQETRMTEAEINDTEKSIKEKEAKGESSAEECETEKANVTQMREWMKSHGKNYYAIYYIDGQKYNEL